MSDYTVVAIGGGPAGISLAIECMAAGIPTDEILVLEKAAVPIDAIRKFYPDKKMTIANYKGLSTETLGSIPKFADLTKAETLTYFDELIAKHNVPMRYNAEVFKVVREDDSLQIFYGREHLTTQFAGIGIGILGRPNKPEYKIPTTLRQAILYDITSQKVENSKVLVVGGGDTSSEYCQVLKDEGNSLTLACRGDNLSRMMDQNQRAVEEMAAAGKLRLQKSCEIVEVHDEAGKPKVIFKDANKFPPEVFDKVIYAIGGTTPINFLKTAGIECDANWPKVGESGETNIPGLYLIGDLAVGKMGGSVITAYNSSFKTTQHILKTMRGG